MATKDLQHFALDESGKVTEIKDSRPEFQYFCPACREKMIRKCGKVRQWHFAHYPDTKCNPDVYLYKLAELKIKEHFDSSKDFRIIMEAVCWKNESCLFGEKCEKGEELVNLKDFYDTCEIEKGYNGYIADLLLTSSKHPNWEPVFLEVFVTHKCEQEKINSGIRIVEIKIDSESDIDRFLNLIELKTREEYNFDDYFNKIYKVYNFQPFKTKKALDEHFNITSLFPSGKTFTEYKNCIFLKNFPYKTSVFQIAFHSRYWPVEQDLMVYCDLKPLLCLVKAKEFGINKKSCNLCKYQKSGGMFEEYPICALYRKLGTEREILDATKAEQCQYYREDLDLTGKLKRVLLQVPHLIRLPNEDWKNGKL